MKVLILAGGLGTRLRSTLGDLPKPLAPINNKPFLEYLLSFISKQGLTDVIISLSYEAGAIREFLGDGSLLGVKIEYIVEKELLGTGGAVKLAEPVVESGEFFTINGDTYFEVDLKEMFRFHKEQGAFATVALSYSDDAGRYGSVIFDKGKRIIAFSEKTEEGKSGYINGGVYIFSNEVFNNIPAQKTCSLEREILPGLIGKGLYGFPAGGYFIDIGIPEDYERAKKELTMKGIL